MVHFSLHLVKGPFQHVNSGFPLFPESFLGLQFQILLLFQCFGCSSSKTLIKWVLFLLSLSFISTSFSSTSFTCHPFSLSWLFLLLFLVPFIKFKCKSILLWALYNLVFIFDMVGLFLYFYPELNQLWFHFFVGFFGPFLLLALVILIKHDFLYISCWFEDIWLLLECYNFFLLHGQSSGKCFY